ncbi:MAG: sulfite exporter TauE/SafE family protein [Terriglobia bacterium]
MELSTLLLLCAAALGVAAVVVASGFGLGTALTPLFLLTYDIKTAILLVAVVHFANNLFRLALFRRSVDGSIVRRFGLASVVGAVVGSLLQKYAGEPGLELGLGALLVVLGGVEFLPGRPRTQKPACAGKLRGRGWRIPRRVDQAGGFLSGLLGGLMGNQGAIRSGYLLNYGLSKDAFIATGTAIACLIDASRIPVYLFNYGAGLVSSWPYLVAVIGAALTGTLVGRRLVARLTLAWFRSLVAGLIALVGTVLIFTNL